jgi:hypothetical protein
MMIIGRPVRSLAVGACATLALALTACSASDDASACADMIVALSQGADSIAAAADDPATAGTQLRAFATNLRASAEGTSTAISTAADNVAQVYDDMADGIETSGVPDMSELTSSVLALEDACS